MERIESIARQRHPNCLVVPYDDAKRLLELAYQKGCQEGCSEKSFAEKLVEYNRRIFNEFNPEDYE